MKLRTGSDRRAAVSLSGRGPHLTLPELPLRFPVTAQLHAEGGACWEAWYEGAAVVAQNTRRLRSRAARR